MAKKSKTDTIKFTEDELNGLQAVRNDYQSVQNEFGALRVRRLQLEQQLNAIESREVELEGLYNQVKENETTLAKTLQDKYGPGNLNTQTGEFTPEVTTNTQEK